ncbi:hypothetical protein GCM10011519_15930 [Marmoricola endophyticus]|uniref:Uncharacterized protein n=1 Tax=Marmoricola endophyticus TaxID=2040280 RepID=A0A917BGS8_9ACTN|nr:hypothetical protein GCM10011519_15930 [Marmoricola endophyticus]
MLILAPSRAEPSRAEPSRAGPGRAAVPWAVWGAGHAHEVVAPLQAVRESALQDLQGPGVAQLRDASAR